jgi:exopolyphosphatase/guanosine-5'-triphosphate,3'-diphosphate pyrophosphatase
LPSWAVRLALNAGIQRALVFDIGGGSTELMWVDIELAKDGAHPITDWLSVSYGVMNLADKFGGTGLSDLTYRRYGGFHSGKNPRLR